MQMPTSLKTPADEQRRYAAVSAQLKELSDQAANSRNPASAILYGLVMAELFDKNEKAHMAYEARSLILGTPFQRAEQREAEQP